MIYAPQAQFKTFFSLDLALSVAGGSDFHGRSVKQGPTVYILGEGRSGLKNRITAWLDEHKTEEVPEVFFVLDAVQFKRPEDVKALSSQIDGMSIKPAMLFIDTFARSAVGLDENNATDVGLWVDAVAALQRDLKVDVVAVHHAQKGQSKNKAPRERGSSAFIGAVDTVIRLDRPSQTRTTVKVRCEKQKDAEEFEPFLLTVKVVSLGKNEHGEQASSCVLVDGPFEIETESNAPETHEYELLLALRGSPNGTATRKELLQRTALTKRTLDRNRDSLQEKLH
jgi:RecA-family ATPase